MNWHHLKTFLWLRWRLRSNQRKRAGTGSAILQTVILVLGVLIAAGSFAGGLVLGAAPLRTVSAGTIMLVWDVIVIVFLFFWTIELLVELQRSELMSLEKFLHLPVSLTGVFLINYVGSMLNISAVICVPAMTGLAIGMAISRGAMLILILPLVAAFMLALTAVTHQFRGWLASLMVNQRRRRTIVAIASVTFVLLLQLPNLLNMTRFSRSGSRDRSASQSPPRTAVSDRLAELESSMRAINAVVPAGWLPYGAMSLSESNAGPALAGIAGLALIGAASLRRSYRTTLRLYTGGFSAGKPRRLALPEQKPVRHATLLERNIPGLSEQASAIAMINLRSMLRAPETKMLFLTPCLMFLIFGGAFLRGNSTPGEFTRPLMATGAVTMLLFMMTALAGNQFGFDRGGFRVFVLSSAARRDILLGKNVSMAPFILGLAMVALIGLQWIYPMRVDHFAATLLQLIPMYLIFSLVSNMMSILAPLPVAQGSLKPATPKGRAILFHLGFMLVFPIALAPTLFPLGIEALLSITGRYSWFPAYLLLTLAEVAAILFIYPLVLDAQGRLMQSREQRILEVVTSKIE